MKKSRFTESQIVAILKEGEAGVAVAQLVRKHGISAATLFYGFLATYIIDLRAPALHCIRLQQ